MREVRFGAHVQPLRNSRQRHGRLLPRRIMSQKYEQRPEKVNFQVREFPDPRRRLGVLWLRLLRALM